MARTGFTMLPLPRRRRRSAPTSTATVEAELVAVEATADVAEDPAQHRRQHDQRDDDDRAADAEPDHQPLAAARARPRRVVGSVRRAAATAAAPRVRRPGRSARCGRRPRWPAGAGSAGWGRCGCRRPPAPRARPPPRSGTGCRGRRRRGSMGWPAESSSAGASPLRTPDSGSGHRLTSSAYSAAPMPRMSSSGLASGSVAGKASATSPSMLTRTRLGWSIDSATPERWAASAAAASDLDRRGRRRSATATCRPPPAASRRGSTRRPPARRSRCCTTSSTRAMPGMSMRLSRSVRDRISCDLLVGQRRVRVDEGQRDLPVQRGVERLPELQVWVRRRGRPAAGSGRRRCWRREPGGRSSDVAASIGGRGGRRRIELDRVACIRTRWLEIGRRHDSPLDGAEACRRRDGADARSHRRGRRAGSRRPAGDGVPESGDSFG